MQPLSLPTRIRAARILGGFRSPKELAEKIGGERGLGAKTIYAMEQGHRARIEFRELWDIAAACEIPVEFFTADLSRLPEISEEPRAVIARETAAAILRAAERRAAQNAGQQLPPAADQQP